MNPQSHSHLQPWILFKKLKSGLLFGVFLLLLSSSESRFLVKTLPGLLGDLPFTLETGYIGVGESQLFYYFVESERNPEDDPLMLWLTGGPGCSALSALLYEIGPFTINYANSTFEKAMLEINPYSWTKEASIIFLDQPAGSGFSYGKTPEAYITNDTSATMHAYQFLRKWLVGHPSYLNNPFYVGADSYGGIVAPMVVHEIYNGNEVGEWPQINIKGYLLGNPLTDTSGDYNSRIPCAHRMGLLSDAIYESTKENCHGEYLDTDSNNSLCLNDLQVVDKCLERIHKPHILEPFCESLFTSLDLLSLPHLQIQGCRDDNYLYSYVWANSKDVREALHIREEFNEIEWVRCNGSLNFRYDKEAISYTHNVQSSVTYHRHIAEKNCRALVYSGDHDMVLPYLGTLKWIESLNLLVVNHWRPWFVDEQVAGYTMKYSNHDYSLTFATIKGGGHTAPEYKPKECLAMLTRWLANDAFIILKDEEDKQIFPNAPDGSLSVKWFRGIVENAHVPNIFLSDKWLKVIQKKVNIFLWRTRRNTIPTRLNVINMGVDIPSTLCPTCEKDSESSIHIFASCDWAKINFLWFMFEYKLWNLFVFKDF